MCVHVCVMGMWGVCEVEYMYDGSLLKFSSGLKRGGGRCSFVKLFTREDKMLILISIVNFTMNNIYTGTNPVTCSTTANVCKLCTQISNLGSHFRAEFCNSSSQPQNVIPFSSHRNYG